MAVAVGRPVVHLYLRQDAKMEQRSDYDLRMLLQDRLEHLRRRRLVGVCVYAAVSRVWEEALISAAV